MGNNLTSYPNQKTIIIKKTPSVNNFLQVNNDEWMAAVAILDNLNAFKLYLYLAANEIGFNKLLSKEDACKKLKMSKSTYYNSCEKLEKCGFLVWEHGNTYSFYTIPQKKVESTIVENKKDKKIIDSTIMEIKSLNNSTNVESNINPDSMNVESNKVNDSMIVENNWGNIW